MGILVGMYSMDIFRENTRQQWCCVSTRILNKSTHSDALVGDWCMTLTRALSDVTWLDAGNQKQTLYLYSRTMKEANKTVRWWRWRTGSTQMSRQMGKTVSPRLRFEKRKYLLLTGKATRRKRDCLRTAWARADPLQKTLVLDRGGLGERGLVIAFFVQQRDQFLAVSSKEN